MRKQTPPVRFSDTWLDGARHVCAFFNNADEEHRVLLPFIRDGFECGQKAVHVVGDGRADAHLQRLRREGIDVDTALANGQFELRQSADTYLSDGRFDVERMLEAFEQLASGNAAGGYPLSRIVCQMDWAAEGHGHIHDVIAFEARVNDVWRRHEDVVICTYDLAKFGGDTVVDILRTHPMVIVGGVLRQNPFYTPPEEFLPELEARRGRPTR